MCMTNGERRYARWLIKDHAIFIEAKDAKSRKVIL